MNCYDCVHSILSDETSQGRWKCGAIHPGVWTYISDKETKKCTKFMAIHVEPPVWLRDDGKDDDD